MNEITDINQLKGAGPRIIIEVIPVKETTAGGIHLTKETIRREQDLVTEGILIDKGEIAFRDMCPNGRPPQIGDRVYFVKYSGKEIKVNDKYYRIVNDEDVYVYEIGENKNA